MSIGVPKVHSGTDEVYEGTYMYLGVLHAVYSR